MGIGNTLYAKFNKTVVSRTDFPMARALRRQAGLSVLTLLPLIICLRIQTYVEEQKWASPSGNL